MKNLQAGYERYRDSVTGGQAYIAPVGLSFKKVHVSAFLKPPMILCIIALNRMVIAILAKQIQTMRNAKVV